LNVALQSDELRANMNSENVKQLAAINNESLWNQILPNIRIFLILSETFDDNLMQLPEANSRLERILQMGTLQADKALEDLLSFYLGIIYISF